MGIALVILLSYILNLILIILIITFIFRIRNIEKKLVNFSTTEAYNIVENMHDMVLESQKLADNLDAAIKSKEAVLEDLSDLVDEKILRFERLTEKSENLAENNKEQSQILKDNKKQKSNINKTENKKNLKSKILELNALGKESIDIARELGISITEVQLALRLVPKE